MSHKNKKHLTYGCSAVESEDLVELCLRAHRVRYIRANPADENDRSGRDIILCLSNPGKVGVQVKRSDNGETIGLLLPLPDPLPIDLEKCLSPKMRERIANHLRLHPDVRYMLFVAHPTKSHGMQAIIADIWTELEYLIGSAEREAIAYEA